MLSLRTYGRRLLLGIHGIYSLEWLDNFETLSFAQGQLTMTDFRLLAQRVLQDC